MTSASDRLPAAAARRPGAPAAVLPARERLLRAVADGLPALDPAAVSVQAICDRAAVRPPSLYHHFGSKDGLVAAAVDALATQWLAQLDQTIDRGASMEVALAQTQLAWLAMITAPQRPFAVFVWTSMWSEASRPALIRARVQAERFIRDFLVTSLGVVDDADDLARLLLDGLLGASVDYQLDGDGDALRRRLATLVGSVRGRGLTSDRPATPPRAGPAPPDARAAISTPAPGQDCPPGPGPAQSAPDHFPDPAHEDEHDDI